jgi:hypothetical protein
VALTNGTIPSGGNSATGVLLYTSASNLGAGTVTSSTYLGADVYKRADFLIVATIAGTTTLDIYLQKLLGDGSTWADIAHATQISATGKALITFDPAIISGAVPIVITDAGLAAGTVAKTGFGAKMRLKGVVAGASPDATFSVYADFYK